MTSAREVLPAVGKRIDSSARRPDSPSRYQVRAALSQSFDPRKAYSNNLRTHKWMIRCGSCRLVIERSDALRNNVIFSLEQYWHRDHFSCSRCKAPIGRDRMDFRENRGMKGMPICLDCHMDEFHPKCKGCKGTLREQCIQAMGNQWHRHCFLCSRCHFPMPNGEFYTINNKPFDVDCYHMEKYKSVMVQHGGFLSNQSPPGTPIVEASTGPNLAQSSTPNKPLPKNANSPKTPPTSDSENPLIFKVRPEARPTASPFKSATNPAKTPMETQKNQKTNETTPLTEAKPSNSNNQTNKVGIPELHD